MDVDFVAVTMALLLRLVYTPSEVKRFLGDMTLYDALHAIPVRDLIRFTVGERRACGPAAVPV